MADPTAPTAARFAAALVTLLALDAVWLSTAFRLGVYPPVEHPKLAYGLVAWAALAYAIAAQRDPSTAGARIGLLTYLVFNGTELAMNERWRRRWHTSVADVVWGTVACATVGRVVARVA